MNEVFRDASAEDLMPRVFFLDDFRSAFLVERGFLDVFAVKAAGSEPVGRAFPVARLTAGKVAFGTGSGRRPDNGAEMRFMAIPSLEAVIVRGERAGLEAAETFDLKTTVWIDDWVFSLSEFLVRDLGPPPSTAKLIEADSGIPHAAGTVLTAYHGDVVWVTANRSMRLAGSGGGIAVSAGKIVPMTERLWIDLDSDTDVSAEFTPGTLVSNRLWPAFDAYNALVLECAVALERKRIEAEEEHSVSAVAANRAAKEKTFQFLSGAMNSGGETVETARTAETDPIRAAATVVAGSLGVEADARRATLFETDPLRTLTAFARGSGLFLRRLSLAPGWWRRNGPSFVGAATDDGRPLAVLSDGRRSYRAVDAETGAAFGVGRMEAEKIASLAIMLYAPLPDRIRNGKDALIHSLKGVGGRFLVVLAMSVLAGLTALLTPVATGQLLAEVIPRVDVPMWTAYLGALLLAAFSGMVFELVRGLATLHIQSRVDERLQSAVWNRLLSLPAPFFREYSSGDLADRANGISQIRQLITGVVAGSMLGGVSALFSFVLLFWYSWRLALCATVLALVLAGATWLFAFCQMKHHRKAFELQGAIEGLVFQMINGLAKLRVANAESHALARWAERYADQRREIYTSGGSF